MDSLLALLPVPAYAAVIAAVALLANRLLAGDNTGLSALFRIDLDPPSPRRRVQEEEPERWNVERLRRPTRAENAPSAGALPTGVAGGLEGVCLP
jgi:hypothetical protein